MIMITSVIYSAVKVEKVDQGEGKAGVFSVEMLNIREEPTERVAACIPLRLITGRVKSTRECYMTPRRAGNR